MKSLITLCIVLCSFVLQAQHYHQLTGENKLWSVYVKPQSIVGTPQWETYYYRFNGDTTINNMSYYRFQFSRDSLNNWYTSKYIREDSTKKVYQWDYLRGEQLLYNFNASVNDTFVNIDSRISVVSAVDSVFIFSSYRKRIHLDYTRIQGSDTILSTHNYWIEGIGSIYNPLDIPKITFGSLLLCYYENDTVKWTNSDYNKCYISHSPSTNIQELNTNTIRYFPNPVTTSFIVEIDNAETTTVEIYSVTGKKMFSKTVIQHEQIDVSDYSIGIYLVKFIRNNQTVHYGKFAK